MSAEASGSGSGLVLATISQRPKRSRRDRPCDPCRKQKHICLIPVRGEPCEKCKRSNRVCTFDAPPAKRPKIIKTGDIKDGDTNEKGSGASKIGNESSLHNQLRRMKAERAREAEESEDSDDDGTYAEPLDLETTTQEESHYVGFASYTELFLESTKSTGGAITPSPSASTPTNAPHPPNKVSFRQVSQDPSRPAFFVKNPRMIYGNFELEGVGGRSRLNSSLELLASTGKDTWPDTLLDIFVSKVLRALPVLNKVRLLASLSNTPSSNGAGPYPHLLLTGIIAHSAFYVPELHHLVRPLWKIAISSLIEDYRQPRLQVLHFAMLDMYASTIDDPGQNCISLGKAVSAAHLLGLHIDPTTWDLPRWEKSVRKRLWWAVLTHDKLSALVYGRPSHLHSSNHNVPIPTFSESDWGRHQESNKDDTDSWNSFLAMCRLTLILDEILINFYTVEALYSMMDEVAVEEKKMAALLEISDDLESFETWAESNGIGIKPSVDGTATASGVRSSQLVYLGLTVLVARLALEGSGADSSDQPVVIALGVAQKMVWFLEGLDASDLESFWNPYSSYHLINCACLLVQAAVRSRGTPLLSKAETILSKILTRLLKFKNEYQWDIATKTLDQVSSLLGSIPKDHFPEMSALKEIFFPAPSVLDLPDVSTVSGTTDSALELQIDPSSWFNFGFPWAEDWLLAGEQLLPDATTWSGV